MQWRPGLSKLDYVPSVGIDPYQDAYIQHEDGSRETIEAMRDRMQLPPAPQPLINHILYDAGCKLDVDALRRDFGGPTREECMRKFSETTSWRCSPSPIPVGGTDRCAVCQRTIVLGERYAEIRVIENCFEHVIVCADHRDPQFARFDPFVFAESDPLDAIIDGLTLRKLVESYKFNQRNENRWQVPFTPAQRDTVSAHWSAQLRAKVAASKAADAARATSVLVEMEVE